MANGSFRLGKQSGGTLGLVFPDGVSNTEVVLPESGELATKQYADLKVALASFVGTNQNLSGNGYQKLPGGLIIQWADIDAYKRQVAYFPITFPNSCVFACANHTGTDSDALATVYDYTQSQFKLSWNLSADPVSQYVFAIGY